MSFGTLLGYNSLLFYIGGGGGGGGGGKGERVVVHCPVNIMKVTIN